MLSRLVIAFLPRSKCLLISWLHSPSVVILEPPKINFLTVSIVSPSICHEVSLDAMILVFWMLSFKPTFHSLLSLSSRGSLVLHFLPLGWYHLYIWGYWYLSWQSWIPVCDSSSLAFRMMYSDVGRDWGQEEKGATQDEMAGWHHGLDGRESEWTLGDGDGQGGLACCDSWGRKESDTTERLNWTELCI